MFRIILNSQICFFIGKALKAYVCDDKRWQSQGKIMFQSYTRVMEGWKSSWLEIASVNAGREESKSFMCWM